MVLQRSDDLDAILEEISRTSTSTNCGFESVLRQTFSWSTYDLQNCMLHRMVCTIDETVKHWEETTKQDYDSAGKGPSA